MYLFIFISTIALILLSSVALYKSPRAKEWRERRAEERKKAREEEERIKKEAAEKREKQLEKLRSQKIAVCIREKDGRKSSFETRFIKMLLGKNIPIEFMKDVDLKKIINEDIESLKEKYSMVINGTTWNKTKKGGGYHTEDCYISEYTYEQYYFDYRLLDLAGEKMKMIGVGYQEHSTEEVLMKLVIEDIISMIPIDKA